MRKQGIDIEEGETDYVRSLLKSISAEHWLIITFLNMKLLLRATNASVYCG